VAAGPASSDECPTSDEKLPKGGRPDLAGPTEVVVSMVFAALGLCCISCCCCGEAEAILGVEAEAGGGLGDCEGWECECVCCCCC